MTIKNFVLIGVLPGLVLFALVLSCIFYRTLTVRMW